MQTLFRNIFFLNNFCKLKNGLKSLNLHNAVFKFLIPPVYRGCKQLVIHTVNYCSENFYVLFFRIAKYNFTCQAKSPMQNHQYTTNTKIYCDIITKKKKKSNKLTSWFVENSLKYDCPCKKGM